VEGKGMCKQDVGFELQAAFRDASFWRKPDTRFAKMAHILRTDGTPSCGLHAMMGDPEPAARVQVVLRCKRRGCRERWPKNDPDDQAYFCRDN
jgi:hypothetical protein